MDVIVIGAGMAGLRVATLRSAVGDAVRVVDKGRRHGGRMATRRVEDATFDTGVLDLAAHTATFRAALERWSAAGHAGRMTGGSDRWRGVPTMRSLPTAIAEAGAYAVHLATAVTSLTVRGDRWEVSVRAADGEHVHVGDALVLTAPAPQALALLDTGSGLASPRTRDALAAVEYEASLTVLVRPADRSLPSDALPDGAVAGAEALDGTDLVRMRRLDLTGTSAVPALTLQASARRSAAAIDGDREVAAQELALQASELVGVPLDVVHVHGWRYAQVTRGIEGAALRDDSSGAPLVLAGDLFEAHGDAPDGSRPEGVERAFLSGGAAAELLDER